MKNTIAKQTDKAFGKEVYLLGSDSDGIKYWLEAPKWDCGWYWGFGYVETYKNNRKPSIASDIDSHSHIDSSFLGSQEVYNHEKKCFVKGEYIHNLYDNPTFAATTFTEKEGWELSELFKSFYSLKESAEMFGRGGSNTSSNPCKSVLQNKEWAKHINEVMIPAVTKQILSILKP